MATIDERLAEDLIEAMRARDDVRLRTIRSLRAALKEKEISERHGGAASLSDDQAIAVIQKQSKQRQDAIEQFEAAGREDLVQRERDELDVIKQYLPEAVTADEIRAVVQRIVSASGARELKDIGKVMGPAMQELRGRADGRLVQQIVREELQGSS